MSEHEKTPDRSADPASSLEKEATAAPEAAWFFAWFKSAGIYLGAVTAYLGIATALVAAWKKFIATEGDKANLTIYVLAGVLALSLLFAFLFNLLPALRRRRERNLLPAGAGEAGYFTTAPRDDDPYGFFAMGYEPFLECIWGLLVHLRSSLNIQCAREAGVNAGEKSSRCN